MEAYIASLENQLLKYMLWRGSLLTVGTSASIIHMKQLPKESSLPLFYMFLL